MGCVVGATHHPHSVNRHSTLLPMAFLKQQRERVAIDHERFRDIAVAAQLARLQQGQIGVGQSAGGDHFRLAPQFDQGYEIKVARGTGERE